MFIYYLIPLSGFAILVIAHFSTAYLAARQFYRVIQAADSQGRSDVSRDLLAYGGNGFSARTVRWFLLRMLRAKPRRGHV
jgi:hypothetical protein